MVDQGLGAQHMEKLMFWGNLCSCWCQILDQLSVSLSALYVTTNFGDLRILQDTSVTLLDQELAAINFLHYVD